MSLDEPDLLLRWYLCYRKEPLTHDEATPRAERLGLQVFPCDITPAHWHIGKASSSAVRSRERLRASAKSRYKKDIERGVLAWQGQKRPLPPGADPLYRKPSS